MASRDRAYGAARAMHTLGVRYGGHMDDEDDDLGDLLGPTRAAVENLLVLFAIALIAAALATGVFWNAFD
jgi:hypothetical protein